MRARLREVFHDVIVIAVLASAVLVGYYFGSMQSCPDVEPLPCVLVDEDGFRVQVYD